MGRRRNLVDLVLGAYLGNPFDAGQLVRDAGREALNELQPADALAALLDGGDAERAALLVLAVGHAQARQHPQEPGRVLDPSSVPRPLAARLPRPLAAYRRVAIAAGRADRALARIRGSSDEIVRTRRATWAACFGDSLRHALEMERVIRDHDVLILGETGTGKELYARAIQDATPGEGDAPAPSAAINAAAIPDTLVESELFGHVKGAFTGATETRGGRIRSADGGAFFLDEVGDLPMTTQVKLLRVIETDEVYPVGADAPERAVVRYVAATHKDLLEMVNAGGFRRDLYERLAGSVIHIPPLRDRPEDILDIGLGFARAYVGEPSLGAVRRFLDSGEARRYRWPGNVRELQNALRNVMLGLDPGLGTGDVSAAPVGADIPEPIATRRAPLEAVEAWYVRAVLDDTGGNMSRAARTLGLDRLTVRRKLDRPS